MMLSIRRRIRPLFSLSSSSICICLTPPWKNLIRLSSPSSSIHTFSSSTTNTNIFHPTEDHIQLRSTVRNFVQREVENQALENNRNETFNRSLFTKLATDLGILGITIPSPYGGCDFTTSYPATASCIIHEELSYSDPAFCLSYLAHSILLVHNLYVNSISEPQKMKFLPPLCNGSFIGGMAMSEVHGGTDVLGRMKTHAILQGPQSHSNNNNNNNSSTASDEPFWILNGSKMWITNGVMMSNQIKRDDEDTPSTATNTSTTSITTGDVFLIYAKTGSSKTDITQFLVEKDMPGFTVGQKIQHKLGMRASPTAGMSITTCILFVFKISILCNNTPSCDSFISFFSIIIELVFNHVALPSTTHVVGHAHQGFTCMMRNLEMERLALAAMAIGIARRCIDDMIRYTKEREAFGKAIIEYGQIQQNIAESYAEYKAAKCYVYSLANAIQDIHQSGNTLDADGVKLFAAQMAKKVADRAIQSMGGYGYVGEYVVERMWRDAKLLEIGGGTNESHHKNMIRILKKQAQPIE